MQLISTYCSCRATPVSCFHFAPLQPVSHSNTRAAVQQHRLRLLQHPQPHFGPFLHPSVREPCSPLTHLCSNAAAGSRCSCGSHLNSPAALSTAPGAPQHLLRPVPLVPSPSSLSPPVYSYSDQVPQQCHPLRLGGPMRPRGIPRTIGTLPADSTVAQAKAGAGVLTAPRRLPLAALQTLTPLLRRCCRPSPCHSRSPCCPRRSPCHSHSPC